MALKGEFKSFQINFERTFQSSVKFSAAGIANAMANKAKIPIQHVKVEIVKSNLARMVIRAFLLF